MGTYLVKEENQEQTKKVISKKSHDISPPLIQRKGNYKEGGQNLLEEERIMR